MRTTIHTLNNRKKTLLIGLGIGVFILSIISLAIGPYQLSIPEILQALLKAQPEDERSKLAELIIWDIRLPRILMAGIVGMALSVSGAIFQSCFRNPLVEPYILGVSSGAAFGASLAIVFPAVFFSMPLAAFLFAGIAVLATLSLGNVKGQLQTVSLLLAGVVIGALFSSLVSMLKYVSNEAALREIVFWLLGGLYHSGWNEIYLLAPIILPITLVVWLYGWKLNVLSMGDDEAKSLGINPRANKLLLIGFATLLTALSVAYAGIIAWVGLMIPHAARMVIGPDNRFVIPLSAFFGAFFVVGCDTLARNLTSGEIPLGIITSIVGAPYLIYLLRTKLRNS